MISSEKEYKEAMKCMVRKVQSGEKIDVSGLSIEEAEVLSDCIKCGYIIGKATEWNERLHDFIDLRTLDGKAHPEIQSSVIPLKGMAFLKAVPDWRTIVPIVISICALMVSIIFRR